MGRTKTTPHADDDVEEVNLAVYSCANYRECHPFHPLPRTLGRQLTTHQRPDFSTVTETQSERYDDKRVIYLNCQWGYTMTDLCLANHRTLLTTLFTLVTTSTSMRTESTATERTWTVFPNRRAKSTRSTTTGKGMPHTALISTSWRVTRTLPGSLFGTTTVSTEKLAASPDRLVLGHDIIGRLE